MKKELFDNGLAVRREVVGHRAVEQILQGADDFVIPMQELRTEYCSRAVWTRPELDRRGRSFLNLGTLAAATGRSLQALSAEQVGAR